MDTRENKGVMVTENTIFHGTDKDPRLMARAGVASAVDN